MAIMNPDLLLKQYHPKHHLRGRQFILVQNLLNHRVKKQSETIVEGRTINSYIFDRRLIHGGIRLKDYESVSSRQEVLNDLGIRKVTARTVLQVRAGWAPGNSGTSVTIAGASPTGEWPFLLSTDLPGAGSPSRGEELVDAPSEDEHLDELSEENEEVSPENEDYLVCPRPTARLETRCEGETWFSPFFIPGNKSYAMVISHGYETSTSGLRTLGVEEYSQLDHEGVPGSKRGTV
ncbi:LOW QUALITY PROTEIN: hypothetical protein Cgig2_006762 [Carnegiea gigantea]|uniref:Uncharacterized protein n=1 Tax=Carnegiea gigantea TaxID=171969 RepID=A0A9Q1GPI5_9CARY|nr:LOW QUALITY PROTEIN: hypothetical protein Cgig2_006762 [Carnegiea gigantea]